MTSVSSTRGPADYANQMREGRQGELLNDDSMLHECSFDVQVIDTDVLCIVYCIVHKQTLHGERGYYVSIVKK